jgi:DNA-binding MarR family transcriptional regulator
MGTAKLFEDVLAAAEVCGDRQKRTKVTLMHFHVLYRLATSEGYRIPQSELVSAIETPKSSAMSTLLDRMEDLDKWIERKLPRRLKPESKRSTAIAGREKTQRLDGRARIVSLTKRGRKVWEEVKPKFDAKLNEYLTNFSAQEIDELAEGLLKLREELRKEVQKGKQDDSQKVSGA